MGKRKASASPPAVPAICKRIEWLLRHRWAGNVSQLARDLGVSQPAVSRVLAGQMPGGKMLEALANTAGVNAAWLLTGSGAGLTGPGGAGGVLCPLADGLLPGPPVDHPERLKAVSLPVASHHALGAAYWFQVGADDPVVRGGENVVAGDYLLVDSSERWVRRPEVYLGRLVVLARPGKGECLLARVRRNEEILVDPEVEPASGVHVVDTFGAAAVAHLLPRRTRAQERGKITFGGRGEVLVIHVRSTFSSKRRGPGRPLGAPPRRRTTGL